MNNALRDTPAGNRALPSRQDSPAAGDEIDLLSYLGACWRYRYVLLLVGMIAAGVTYVINRGISPTYEVTFRLLAAASPLDDRIPTVTMAGFRELLQSQSLVQDVLTKVGLTQPPHNLSAQRFLAEHVSVSPTPDTSILNVAVRLSDPTLLVAVAQEYANSAVSRAQELNEGVSANAVDRIRKEVDESLTRLKGAEHALTEFQRRTQIELLRSDVDTMLLGRPEALELTVRIEAERARLRQVETELARHERIREARRTVDSVAPLTPLDRALPSATSTERKKGSTAAAPPDTEQPPGTGGKTPSTSKEQAESAAPARRQAPEAVRGSSLQQPDRSREETRFRSEVLDPYVNPVYEALERDVADSRSRLAGMERQRAELVRRLDLDAPTASRLNRLYEAEAGLTQLIRERDLARTAYMNAASQYDTARLQLSIRSTRFQVLDSAARPDRPVAPRVARNTATAALVALTFGAFAVIVFDGLRRRRLTAT